MSYSEQYFWKVLLESFSYGDYYKNMEDKKATFDTSAKHTIVPRFLFDKFKSDIQDIPGVNCNDTDCTGPSPCTTITSSMSDLTFTLLGNKFTIPPEGYTYNEE